MGGSVKSDYLGCSMARMEIVIVAFKSEKRIKFVRIQEAFPNSVLVPHNHQNTGWSVCPVQDLGSNTY